MRLLWAYEHDIAAISPFLSEKGAPAGALGDPRASVRASPPGTSPRTSYSSHSVGPVRLLGDFAGSSHGMASISFGAPPEDSMSIAASGDGLTSSEDEGAVGLPPSGVVASAASDLELTAMLARAAASIGLEVNRPPSPEPSRLDDWFLGAGRGSQPRPTPVPFFPEVHEELTLLLTLLPRRDAPAAAAAPRTRPPSARRRGRPPASSRAAPPRAEAEARPARRASRRSAASPASHPGPKSSRKSARRP